MANEATLVLRLQDRFPQCKIAAGAVIPKGTVLKLADANLGAASSADGDIFLGIALSESDATTADTTMTYASKGIYDMKLTAVGVSAGDPLKIAGANLVALADDATAAGLKEIVGIALQDGAASEVIEVRLGL